LSILFLITAVNPIKWGLEDKKHLFKRNREPIVNLTNKVTYYNSVYHPVFKIDVPDINTDF